MLPIILLQLALSGSNLDIFVSFEAPRTFRPLSSFVVSTSPASGGPHVSEVIVSILLQGPGYLRGHFVNCVPQQAGHHWRSQEA